MIFQICLSCIGHGVVPLALQVRPKNEAEVVIGIMCVHLASDLESWAPGRSDNSFGRREGGLR